nr:uncharacterized protein LOC116426888 [Nomia melanderi]
MDAYETRRKDWEDLEVTKEEIKTLKECLKKEEFRKLLIEYAKEVTDPENRKLYEKEITQLEKERGVDVVFVNPEPGYVIKTSVNGDRKCFLNISKSDILSRPSSQPLYEQGHHGLEWYIPYLLTPPRDDLDKKNVRCMVVDVVFHPDTIYLASKNAHFRDVVNDTAMDGVESNFQVKLDRKNLKFPKMNYKGICQPSVIRKPSKEPVKEQLDMEPEIYQKLMSDYDEKREQQSKRFKKKPSRPSPPTTYYKDKQDSNSDPNNEYVTPKFSIKHQSDIELEDFRISKDAKMNATVPKRLIISIDLPLLRTAADATLDVQERSLSLNSEKPAKYLLELPLPYHVDPDSGNAKFDPKYKKLVVTLPVIPPVVSALDAREDLAIDCVHDSPEPLSPEDSAEDCPDLDRSNDSMKKLVEVYEDVCTISEKRSERVEDCSDTALRTSSIENLETFLDPSIKYTLPAFTCNICDNQLAITVNVKNVDPNSICHRILLSNLGIHVKLTSIGAGFFPQHYSLCLKIREDAVDPESLVSEPTDDNVVFKVTLTNTENLAQYYVGTDEEFMEQKDFPTATAFKNQLEELTATEENEPEKEPEIQRKQVVDYDDKRKQPSKRYKKKRKRTSSLTLYCQNKQDPNNKYMTPKFSIKHESDMELEESRSNKETKSNGTLPKKLTVTVDLPLLRTATDATLDLQERSLNLKSEKPAKYSLDLSLPCRIDPDRSNTKFDLKSKKLVVTLPVIPHMVSTVDTRQDLGTDSEHSSPIPLLRKDTTEACHDQSHSRDPMKKLIEEYEVGYATPGTEKKSEHLEKFGDTAIRTSIEIADAFLDPSIKYLLPAFTCNIYDSRLAITVTATNLDPSSIHHRVLQNNLGIHVKLTSVDAACLSQHYSLCLTIRKDSVVPESLSFEPADNNVVFKVALRNTENLAWYHVGVDEKCMEQKDFPTAAAFKNQLKGLTEEDVPRKEPENQPKQIADYDDKRKQQSRRYRKKRKHTSSLAAYCQNKQDSSSESNKYGIPEFSIKYHSDVELDDFGMIEDADINAAVPKSLIVTIYLPLLRTAADASLDVQERTLSLKSEKPAKYLLDLPLPYRVNAGGGNSKFDPKTKKLVVTLPVIPFVVSALDASQHRAVDSDHDSPIPLLHKDSAEDSPDQSGSRDSAKKLIEECEVVFSTEETEKTSVHLEECFDSALRTTTENADFFLDPSVKYSLPAFTCNIYDSRLIIILNVKRVDPNSVRHRVLPSNLGVHVKLSSVDTGFHLHHYSFCLKIREDSVDPESPVFETSDDNVVLTVTLRNTENLASYYVGIHEGSMDQKDFSTATAFENQLKGLTMVENVESEKERTVEVKAEEDGVVIKISSNQFGSNEHSVVGKQNKKSAQRRHVVRKARSISESSGEDMTSNSPPSAKGILKFRRTHDFSRTLYESSTDENGLSTSPIECSYDSVDISSESDCSSLKKTVRFNNVVSQQFFRSDSSIRGMRMRKYLTRLS